MRIIIFGIGLLVLASCHTSKKTTSTAAPKPAVQTGDTAQPATALIQVGDTTYRPPDSLSSAAMSDKMDSVTTLTEGDFSFQVSFISKGEGIDNKAKRNYAKFVSQYESNHGVKLPYEEVSWGREGEIDFGFSFDGINAVQRMQFVEASKAFLREYELVRFAEHVPHK